MLKFVKNIFPIADPKWAEGGRKGLIEWAGNGDIRLYVYGSNPPYVIERDRFQTDGQKLDWLQHLTRKTWGADVLPDLIDLFEAHRRRQLNA